MQELIKEVFQFNDPDVTSVDYSFASQMHQIIITLNIVGNTLHVPIAASAFMSAKITTDEFISYAHDLFVKHKSQYIKGIKGNQVHLILS